MFATIWSRNALAAVAAVLMSAACLTAAIGPATQSGTAVAARVLA